MKIYSWNINGLRAVLKKPEFKDFLDQQKPDVLLMQEIKINEEARLKKNIDFEEFGYKAYWNSAERPGYSGTLTLIKKDLDLQGLSLENGIGIEKFDTEGRVQTIEFADFYLLNIYFPNANRELTRLDYKVEFDLALEKYVGKLSKKKSVILGGDFNVAHDEIDLARPENNKGNAGFTKEERKWIHAFLKKDFVDVWRKDNSDRSKYTWWTYRAMARERNIGWRIDYFLVTKDFLSKVKEVEIHDQIFGSDHCPISIETTI
ncbi:MAG: exodeoxyribonuclease III [Patescibacteria group bacterium]|nr:exodeoxyribonuclease III [Patescibacteria group bacterium]